MKKICLLSLVGFLSACASNTSEIAASYVSPMEYESYNCKQLSSEISRVTRRANQVAHDVNKNAEGDSIAMGAGLILFWPALFFIDGDTPQAQEYAELKGRFNALEDAMVKKNCENPVKENPFNKIEQDKKSKNDENKRGSSD